MVCPAHGCSPAEDDRTVADPFVILRKGIQIDNIYIVASKTNIGDKGEIVVNVHSNSNIVGIATTGSFDTDDDAGTLSLGYLSWGRLYNFGNRLNPVSIGVTGLVVDSGLSTFPTITRTGNFGLRRSGALQKEANTNNMSFYP